MSRKSSKPTAAERLEITSEGTAAQAAEIFKLEEQEAEERKTYEQDLLQKNRATFHTYFELIATLLISKLREVDWQGFTYEVAPTHQGVIMEIKSPDGRYFRQAFKPSGEKVFDLAAIEVFVMRAENTIERVIRESLPVGKIWTKNN